MDEIGWLERIELFRWALLSALFAGLVCPWIGAFLLVRRTSFQGIALPQISLAGVALGFGLLPWCMSTLGWPSGSPEAILTDPHTAMNYSLIWASLFSLAGLGLLLYFGRRGEGETARIAAAFALANAAIYIFARYAPFGRNEIEELLHGEIQFLGLHEFEMVAVTCAAVAVLLGLFHKDLLLVSYDRDSARILKKSVMGFEALLLLLVALIVSVGTMTLGPTLLFGLLVLPPLSARRFARSMRQFQLLSAAGGLFSVVAGVGLSFELDLPLGAAIVAAGGLLLLPGFVLRTPRA